MVRMAIGIAIWDSPEQGSIVDCPHQPSKTIPAPCSVLHERILCFNKGLTEHSAFRVSEKHAV